MNPWTIASARPLIHDVERLTEEQLARLVGGLNLRFPPAVYEQHRRCRARAVENQVAARSFLVGATQKYPLMLTPRRDTGETARLDGCALVFTAGGEGERLRLSLLQRGVQAGDLADFTKATFPLPGFFGSYGALQANLAIVRSLCMTSGCEIPVIVTTGPAGSVTARVVPQILAAHDRFGLKHVRVVEQDERLHLTQEDRIAWKLEGENPIPVTQPDETGGPIMKLKQPGPNGQPSALAWLRSLGCSTIILLQATALYDPALILDMAEAANGHDCVGVGILRRSFDPGDPFGTFVSVVKDGREQTAIVECAVRNDATLAVKDPSDAYHLPYNTGFYVFDADLLAKSDLPDYATPPKEILPGLPKTPKVGYAATDLITLARSPAVLATGPERFAVIKNADDLAALSTLAGKYGLDELCARVQAGLPPSPAQSANV